MNPNDKEEPRTRIKKDWRDEAAATVCKRARLENKKTSSPADDPTTRESFTDWVKRVGEEAE
jgi:hypothetical protein